MAFARRRLATNPFVFPGTTPGVNWQHPAAKMLTLSAVPLGSTMIDLTTGARGVPSNIAGALPFLIGGWGTIGPVISFAGTDGRNVGFSGKAVYGANAAPLNDTVAAIFYCTLAATEFFIALGTSGTDTNYTQVGTTGANTTFAISHQSFAQGASIWPGALNVPIFLAASQSLSGSTAATQTYNIVMRRLDTGQLYANSGTNSGYSAGSRNGTFNVGSRGAGSNGFTGGIAAVMANDAFFPLSTLVQWSDNPWALWYTG